MCLNLESLCPGSLFCCLTELCIMPILFSNRDKHCVVCTPPIHCIHGQTTKKAIDSLQYPSGQHAQTPLCSRIQTLVKRNLEGRPRQLLTQYRHHLKIETLSPCSAMLPAQDVLGHDKLHKTETPSLPKTMPNQKKYY